MREKTKSELLDEIHKINVKINKFSKGFALCRESSVNEIIASQNLIAEAKWYLTRLVEMLEAKEKN